MRSELVPQRKSIVGPERLIRATLATQQRQGRLLTPPERIAITRLPDGRHATFVDLLLDTPVPWRKRHPVAFPLAIGGGAVLALLGVGAGLTYVTFRTLGAAIDRPAALGFLVIAAGLGLAFLSKGKGRSDCPGVVVHCRDHKH